MPAVKKIRDSLSSGRAYFLTGLLKEHNIVLAVFEDPPEAEAVYNDLRALGETSACLFTEDDSLRAVALSNLLHRTKNIIVSDAVSVASGVPSRNEFTEKFRIVKGTELSPQDAAKKLCGMGFEKSDFVFDRGKFSLRGGVMDLWDFASPDPFRIRFGISGADSINLFDPSTQLSGRGIDTAEISGSPHGGEKIFSFFGEPCALARADGVSVEAVAAADYVFSPDGADTGIRRAPVYSARMDFLLKDLKSFASEGFRIKIFCAGNDAREYLEEEITFSGGIPAEYIHGDISGGFLSRPDKLLCLKSAEILGFGGRLSPAPRSAAAEKFTPEAVYKRGDIVVHEDYGIGKFIKLAEFEIKGKPVDYVSIAYADGTAHIPVEEFARLHRWKAPRGVRPVISRLGADEFKNKKSRVYKNVFSMAKEIMETGARRKKIRGVSFKPSSAENDFIRRFPYEETPDQRLASRRILSEMEKPFPMEHLLCGDVGYGKTEIAMRAAFRCCWGGYQAVCVVPTTILAQQQYYVFRERFKGFPVEIDMLSRFSASRRGEVVERLASGRTDILIATHSAFSKDIVFAKLGLAVIDEEHRFGVRQKEVLKNRYPSADILMMSATPIPRTLSMSFSGILSFSIIESPPPGRMRVETFTGYYNDDLLREAVRREISRGGQIFYVYNRISGINKLCEDFMKMFPRLRVVTAHAGMSAQKLSEVMRAFANGEYDVLISTVIIQSGLDISNVNTLIIRKSQLLGLSQMYQLRGRVGRGTKRAYCYFFYDSEVKKNSMKRLEFLRDYDALSSGLKIAMSDMELRGAGNIFGPQQHGYIKDVGSELYFKLLEKAVKRLKGEADVKECRIVFSSGGRYIPEDYVVSQEERFRLLMRLSRISSLEQLDRYEAEIVDRFGVYPETVKKLMESARLRITAIMAGISGIEETSSGFNVSKNGQSVFYALSQSDLIKKFQQGKAPESGCQPKAVPTKRER
ncbi:MAG: helicase-related protein [Elusimicrobiota bacterium]|nr:helicase-related protein [Elusimicrobiota bacterium]